MGLRGKLPLYIKEFLSKRAFRVRVDEIFSERFNQVEGVAQGSVFSVALFSVKIDQLRRALPENGNMHTFVYVDDFQLGYGITNTQEIGRKLQLYIDIIQRWADNNGFIFSVNKTKAVLFTQQSGIQLKPELQVYNHKIKYEDCVKFLGMIFDSKLNLKIHIARLKAKCKKAVGLLKSVATLDWGGDMATGMHLYQVLGQCWITDILFPNPHASQRRVCWIQSQRNV